MEDEKENNLITFLASPGVQFALLIMKVIFVGLLVYFAFLLSTEIESIKLLGNDACAYCMEKTGAYCSLSDTRFPPSTNINLSGIVGAVD